MTMYAVMPTPPRQAAPVEPSPHPLTIPLASYSPQVERTYPGARRRHDSILELESDYRDTRQQATREWPAD